MPDKNTFAKTLRALMKEQKLSQRALAAKLGITFQAVSTWCSGKNYPECDMLLKIASYFGVSTDYLLTGIKPENQSAHDALGLSDEAIESLKFLRADNGAISRVNALLCDKAFFSTYLHALSNIEIDSKRFLNPNEEERENPERTLGFLRFSFEYALHDMAAFFRKFFREHTDIDKAESLYEEIKNQPRLDDEGAGDNSLKL